MRGVLDWRSLLNFGVALGEGEAVAGQGVVENCCDGFVMHGGVVTAERLESAAEV